MAKWLSEDQATVWLDIGSPADGAGYWVHSLDPPGARRLSAGSGSRSSITLDVSPNGKEAIFMSLPGGTEPFIWNQETQELRSLPVDLAQWRHIQGPYYYGPYYDDLRPFSVHWHPDGDKVLFQDNTWVFLYDLTTESGCEIDMMALSDRYRYIHEISWSPNGRYLLMNVAERPVGSGRLDSVPMLVLDMYTGDIVHYLPHSLGSNFSWAPDSQTVVMIDTTGENIGIFPAFGFYLFNVRSGEHRRILPEHETLGAMGEWITWSSGGARLALQCRDSLPIGFETGEFLDRVCVSQISLNQ